ncbi:sec1 family domain-containing protein 2-like isoform X2 [Xenia sp. Carnegie-2017]|uniref:sec1 family domain-containing protein 2-like isoform X2 n=1 Tax=Xenia sp. Carnegie-2017 TaxID=2897299 RepID=UPI001F03BAA6|nr:sec1 family domain-containing protein 2-like isoform X2 [Xenia sp. Carnegie-2017]
MADDIRLKLIEQNRRNWESVVIAVNNALVYIDDNIAEILHWSQMTLEMINAGALRVQSIERGKSGFEDEQKVVFITSSLLPGKKFEKLQKLVESSYFQSCSIFCTVADENVSVLIKQGENESFYAKLEEKVSEWMDHKFSTVDIQYIPCFWANIVPGVFLIPQFTKFFPILPSDVPTMTELMKTKGDQKKLTSLSEVEIHHTPKSFQMKLKLLALAFSELLNESELHEDCYAIGHTSKLLASELASLSSAKMKKNIKGRCSVLFIDRTLDLVQISSKCKDNLGDKIFDCLPKLPGHNIDVAIDLSSLFTSVSKNILPPGSLCHKYQEKEAHFLLSSLITDSKQNSITKLYKKLTEILKEESISFVDEDFGKVTPKKLLSLMNYFRDNIKLFIKHSVVLQLAMAVINSSKVEENSNIEEIQSAEKVLQLSLNEEDSPSCYSHILLLLKNVREGIRSFCLEDILLFLVYTHSLVGDNSYDVSHSEEEELKLKNEIMNDVLAGKLKVKTKFIIDDEKDSKNVKRNKIIGCLQRIFLLKKLRTDLSSFRDLFTNTSSKHDLLSYESLIKQVLQKIFDPRKTEINDIEFKSVRLKDFIKSGFSLFLNVSKPHPCDHPILIIFVVGGLTCSEVQQIQEFLSTHDVKTQLLVVKTPNPNRKSPQDYSINN